MDLKRFTGSVLVWDYYCFFKKLRIGLRFLHFFINPLISLRKPINNTEKFYSPKTFFIIMFVFKLTIFTLIDCKSQFFRTDPSIFTSTKALLLVKFHYLVKFPLFSTSNLPC